MGSERQAQVDGWMGGWMGGWMESGTFFSCMLTSRTNIIHLFVCSCVATSCVMRPAYCSLNPAACASHPQPQFSCQSLASLALHCLIPLL